MENVKDVSVFKEEYIVDNNVNENIDEIKNLDVVDDKKNSEEDGVIVYKLKKPFDFEGTYIETIEMDFDSLTGRDLEEATKALTTEQKIGVIETEKAYLAVIAAKAAKLPKEFMLFCSAKDYTNITIEAQAFLLN